ncbi:MAG TPA: hypothetical protein VJW23_14555, partial [Propionibacteriaceae bacterium]|nr:hypothetical protein [Propionibacteriaceae bacterium]
MDVSIKVPQLASPDVPAPSEIKQQRVTLPEGFSINPNAADGKVVCTDEQGAFGTTEEAHCPEQSKVGTAVLDSSTLPSPITGAIYLGESLPSDKYRLFLTADGYGTHVKLAGSVTPDPKSGQISVEFVNLPQSPFSEFNLHFFGSERGLLATPTSCGTFQVHSEFVPWDEALGILRTTSYFSLSSGPEGSSCPGPERLFNPTLEAGTLNSTAAAHTPMVLRVRRRDGEQNVAQFAATLPSGLLASLRGVAYCPESALSELSNPSHSGIAELTSPACPASSRVGGVVAEVGAGTHPLTTQGQAYLAGPYKGAPLSLVVVVPAVSGPYDLGNAVVRSAIDVDPVTADISARSDKFPQILEGIPLRLRS